MIKGIFGISLLLVDTYFNVHKTENVFGWFEASELLEIRSPPSGSVRLTTIIIKLNPRVEIFSFRRAEMSGDCVWKARELS